MYPDESKRRLNQKLLENLLETKNWSRDRIKRYFDYYLNEIYPTEKIKFFE